MTIASRDYGPYYDDTLGDLYDEISAYEAEEDIWMLLPGTSNRPGNLALHLVGNLNHFIGFALGETGYTRDRPAEFGDRDVSRTELLRMISDTREMLKSVFASLDDDLLQKPYPKPLWGDDQGTVQYFLNKLIWHLGYHVGQVNYHRRWANSARDSG